MVYILHISNIETSKVQSIKERAFPSVFNSHCGVTQKAFHIRNIENQVKKCFF